MKKLIFIAITAVLLATNSFAAGSFSSGRGSYSSTSRSYSSPRSYSRPTTTITRTTVVRSRSYAYCGYYSRGYHPMMMGGFGMGYGYSNGLVEGLILGSLMHPAGTVVYNGGGYGGNALLYPDGTVVDSRGYQVGTYANGQFMAQAGGMMAQPAPLNPSGTPVQVYKSHDSFVTDILVGFGLIFIIIILAMWVL